MAKKKRAKKQLPKKLLKKLMLAVVVLLLIPPVSIFLMRWINPVTSTFILRNQIINNQPVQRQWLDLADMASCMPLAVVAAEDQNFPYHHGFDWHALQRAAAARINGSEGGGGSTISQQTAKNLFLWPQQTLFRKGLEAYITVWLELLWPKQRILEVYLNTAQFGPYVYGVEAAAQQFWHKSAAAIEGQQCALLAAVLPAPTQYSAGQPSIHIWHRMVWIRQQMYLLGHNYLQPILR